MGEHETRLESARRHVALQERVVAVQKETVSALKERGDPTDLAEKMLLSMERTLATLRADLARLSN